MFSYDRDLKDILNYALDAHGIDISFPELSKDAPLLLATDDVDYIILDHNMPDINGFELIEQLGELCPAAIIIVLSEEDKGMEFLCAGANDFLQKPFIPYRLVMMLDGGDIRPNE